LTCLGINNEGKLVFDYYHQDYGENSTSGVQDVYNGKTSVLWTNFHEAFAQEIQTVYQSWRVSGSEKLSYNKMLKYFITDQTDRWSISMYNEDAEFKYIAALRNNNNSEYLYQVRGTGEEHFKYFVKNRLMFCDSKWFTGDFVANTNRIILRTNTPLVEGAFAPNPTISYKTFSNMYAAVRYGTNTKPIVKYTPRDTLVSLGSDVSTIFKDTDTYIFGANQISYLDDLSRLYCSTLNISAATKLVELNVGCADDGYENPNLKGLSFTNNRLLRKVNVCNCNGFTSKVLDFSLCPDIQEILATGSNITGVDLPDSGYLKIAKLPATIDNIKLVNQKHIQTFECEGYANLKSIRIENSVNVPVAEILSAIQDDSYPNVRIVNMDWNIASASELSKIVNKLSQCKALDASGLATTDIAVVTGRVYVNDTVSDELRAFVHQNFPDLVIIDKTGNTFYYVDYLTIDGEVYATELILADETPSGPDTQPDDIIMDNHRYLFQDWDFSNFKKNQNNRISGKWLEQFALKFYADRENVNPLYIQWADRGDTAKDPVSEGLIVAPTKQGTNDIQYEFNGWENLPTNVQMATNIYASYNIMHPVRFYSDSDLSTLVCTQWVVDGKNATDPLESGELADEPTKEGTADMRYAFTEWNTLPTNVTTIVQVYALYTPAWAVRFYNDGVVFEEQWVLDGSSATTPEGIPTRRSTAQYDYAFSKWEGDYTNVTESRSIVAVYTNIIRKYNVYFYNEEALIQTIENVQYGSSVSYSGSTPVKTGVDNPEEYEFKGWVPEPTNITGETKCYALFKFTGYIKDDWAAIAANVANGTATELYQIGGRKEITITLADGTEIAADVEIAAYNHDDLADSSGKATLTFFCKDLPNLTRAMNKDATNEGGWEASEMRTFVNGELFDGMPEELKNIIKPVYKISDGGLNNKTLITTIDKLWLASYDEVGLANSSSSLSGQGTIYSSIFTSNNNSRIKYVLDSVDKGRWWLRSSCYSSTEDRRFWRIQLTGSPYGDGAYGLFYVAFGFCI
jgi:hypothetical protein